MQGAEGVLLDHRWDRGEAGGDVVGDLVICTVIILQIGDEDREVFIDVALTAVAHLPDQPHLPEHDMQLGGGWT